MVRHYKEGSDILRIVSGRDITMNKQEGVFNHRVMFARHHVGSIVCGERIFTISSIENINEISPSVSSLSGDQQIVAGVELKGLRFPLRRPSLCLP